MTLAFELVTGEGLGCGLDGYGHEVSRLVSCQAILDFLVFDSIAVSIYPPNLEPPTTNLPGLPIGPHGLSMFYSTLAALRFWWLHQEDDTALGATWRDLACLALLGTLANKPSYAKCRQLPQILTTIPKSPNS